MCMQGTINETLGCCWRKVVSLAWRLGRLIAFASPLSVPSLCTTHAELQLRYIGLNLFCLNVFLQLHLTPHKTKSWPHKMLFFFVFLFFVFCFSLFSIYVKLFQLNNLDKWCVYSSKMQWWGYKNIKKGKNYNNNHKNRSGIVTLF